MSDLPILVGGYTGGPTTITPISSNTYLPVDLPHFTHTLPGYTNHVVFDPQGRYYAFSGPSSYQLWDIATSSLAMQNSDADQVYFSPDGQWFMTAKNNGTATRIYDAATLTFHTQLSSVVSSLYNVDFSLDESMVALTDYYQRVQIHRTSDGVLLRTINTTQDNLLSAVFSADGSRILVTNFHGRNKIYDVGTGAELDSLGLDVYSLNAISRAVRSKSGIVLCRNQSGALTTYALSPDIKSVVGTYGVGGTPFSGPKSDVVLVYYSGSGPLRALDTQSLSMSAVLTDPDGVMGMSSLRFAIPGFQITPDPQSFWTQRIRTQEII